MANQHAILRTFKALGLETEEKREKFRRLESLGEPKTVICEPWVSPCEAVTEDKKEEQYQYAELESNP